jgi:hypothetical protein
MIHARLTIHSAIDGMYQAEDNLSSALSYWSPFARSIQVDIGGDELAEPDRATRLLFKVFAKYILYDLIRNCLLYIRNE